MGGGRRCKVGGGGGGCERCEMGGGVRWEVV